MKELLREGETGGGGERKNSAKQAFTEVVVLEFVLVGECVSDPPNTRSEPCGYAFQSLR